MKEMKCLYDISRAAGESHSTDEFLSRVVGLIPPASPYPEATGVRITCRGRVFTSPDFRQSPHRITENLNVGGEACGALEIHSRPDNPCLEPDSYLARALAASIGGAVRRLELEMSLGSSREPLETMQEKLIRAERLAAVGELASGVGHELRNPLNAIRNCAYLLGMYLAENGDEEVRSALEILDKQVDAANKIATDLLDFTRIRPPSPERTDLHALIEESLSYVTVPDEIKVKSSFNGRSPRVRIDAEQIGRVVTNVIANACQSMSARGELEITTDSDDSGVRVSVKDSGCGIPPENIGSIFEPLFTTKPKGIGLGLAISKRLVEQNGGKIEVESQVGKGTTFTISLPPEIGRQT